jgi:PAS domain S-box-containing protein
MNIIKRTNWPVLGKTIAAGIGLLAGYWLAVSLLDTYIFHEGDLAQALFSPGSANFWERIPAVILLFTVHVTMHFAAYRYRKTQKDLRESEQKYRSLVNNLKLGIYRATPDVKGKFLETNPAMQEITGYTQRELSEMNISDLYIDPLERKQFIETAMSSRGNKSQEVRCKKKDGIIRTLVPTITPVEDGSGQVMFFDGILEDITERKAMEKRIIELYETEKKQKEELEEEARLRGLFIDVLAHELRNPLTPIAISSALLKEMTSPQKDGQVYQLADSIDKSTAILSKRLEQLLDLARFSRGAFTLKKESVNLQAFLEEAAARFRPSLEQQQQQLKLELATDLPKAEIDASRLEQVLQNLLSNAGKFSPPRSEIKLSAGMSKEGVLIAVKDHGVGIEPLEQNKLFQPYHRVEMTRQKVPGLGLGLAVSKQIVEAHGGKIGVSSQPGQGSTFYFTLPAKINN